MNNRRGPRVDENGVFDDQELADADFSNAKVYEASFRRTNLVRANFYAADAADASFQNSSIEAARFNKANIQGCRFDHAQGRDALFEKADLSDAVFVDAVLPAARFNRAILFNVDFRRAHLRGAHFTHAGLKGADFREADVSDALFDNAQFDRSVRLEGCIGLSTISLTSILVGTTRLEGARAHDYLARRAQPIGINRGELELFYADELAGRTSQPKVAAVFAHPEAAVDFTRVLGAPINVRELEGSSSQLSKRHEFVLERWPSFIFGVNVNLEGEPWGIGFTGKSTTLPADLVIKPGEWTLAGLRGAGVEFLDEQGNGSEVVATIMLGAFRYRATFKYGMLTRLTPSAS